MATSFLIGLTGYAGTGKDTVRAILQAQHGFTGLAFADPIRAMLRELLTSNGISDACMDDRALKEAVIPLLGVSYRQLAQTLGTEWGRSLRSDFWLRVAGAYMADLEDAGHTHFVISDVRFANEAAWVRQRGGLIWRVQRAQAPAVNPHISESGVDQIKPDWTIHNDGTPVDLAEVVDEALKVMV